MVVRLGQPQGDAQVLLGLDCRRALSAKLEIFETDHATAIGRSCYRVPQGDNTIPTGSLGRCRRFLRGYLPYHGLLTDLIVMRSVDR